MASPLGTYSCTFCLDRLAPGSLSASALRLPPLPQRRNLCLRLASSGAIFGHGLDVAVAVAAVAVTAVAIAVTGGGVAIGCVGLSASGRRRRRWRRIRQILDQ